MSCHYCSTSCLIKAEFGDAELQEQLVTREHRKEARKRKKAGDASGAEKDGEGSAANGATEKDVVVENADELPPQVQSCSAQDCCITPPTSLEELVVR